jgi:CheY-like chemotaxis protein
VAHDGIQALEKFEFGVYDVLVLDRYLPGLHGDEVCRRVVESGLLTWVLMLTAAASTRERVPAGEVEELFEPFRRLQPRRRGPGEGAGLGLSIVASIARAHHAGVIASANPDGLMVQVTFPGLAGTGG